MKSLVDLYFQCQAYEKQQVTDKMQGFVDSH